jgi:hypothetical protein
MGYLLSCSDHALQWSEGADSSQCSWKGSCQQYKGLEIVSAVLTLYSKPSTSGTPLVKIHIDQGSSTDAEAGQPYSFHLLHCHHPTGKKNPGLRVLGFRPPVPSCCLLLLPPLPKSQPNIMSTFWTHKYWVLTLIFMITVIGFLLKSHSWAFWTWKLWYIPYFLLLWPPILPEKGQRIQLCTWSAELQSVM